MNYLHQIERMSTTNFVATPNYAAGMTKRFAVEQCTLCTEPSTRRGEHVWPLWLIGDFEGEGPFYSEKAGRPYTKRDGVTVARFQALPGTHVPMCQECNGRMNTVIEEPAKPVVRKVMPWSASHSWPVLTPDEAAALGRWFLKVGLLLSHPKASDDNPQVATDKASGRPADFDPEWIGWLMSGDDPPADFTVYACRRSLDHETPWAGDKQRLLLPKRIIIDGVHRQYMTRSFGIRGVDVSIVFHPGWPIDHPLVTEARAAVLWPNPGPVDFGALGGVHPGEYGLVGVGTVRATGVEFARLSAEPLQIGRMPGHNALEVLTEPGSSVTY